MPTRSYYLSVLEFQGFKYSVCMSTGIQHLGSIEIPMKIFPIVQRLAEGDLDFAAIPNYVTHRIIVTYRVLCTK